MHLSFLTSHNLLFFRFCKTSKKTTFSFFLSFFLVKSPKSQSLKLNISRTAWPILMTLVSFCRILNGLSDEINLFWRCSSPLNIEMDMFWSFACLNSIKHYGQEKMANSLKQRSLIRDRERITAFMVFVTIMNQAHQTGWPHEIYGKYRRRTFSRV